MAPGSFRFERFTLDPQDRRLCCEERPVELSARYLDALVLLVRENGKLVSKDRFLDEVWRGVPVTDEALTQCIKTLRKQLGDEAARPRFIETVPKHGYRFIAPVGWAGEQAAAVATGAPAPASEASASYSWQDFLLTGAAGMAGGGVAGIFGGLFYGFGGALQPLAPGMGTVSILLVLICLSVVAGLIGGAAVGFGIAASGFVTGRLSHWSIAGGAFGGLVVGAFAKLLGLDAFNLLFGRTPGDITGATEGGLLGAAVGLGVWLAIRTSGPHRRGRSIGGAALAGGGAGILISLLGGRMMGGSLDLLASNFPGSRLRLDGIGGLFGEQDFGFLSRMVTGALEGLIFSASIVAALLIAQRSLSGER